MLVDSLNNQNILNILKTGGATADDVEIIWRKACRWPKVDIYIGAFDQKRIIFLFVNIVAIMLSMDFFISWGNGDK